MTNYHRGRTIEYKLVARHRKLGAAVTGRTAGSHSAVDVFAIYPDTRTVVFQQTKRSKRGHFGKVISPFPNGRYMVRFEVKNWCNGRGFIDE